MPAYIGNKKVKELYYGGKKIKEAWYGSKKVYSSSAPEWKEGVTYKVGDLVTVEVWSKKGVYRCKFEHVANTSDNIPYAGPMRGVYWEEVS